MAVLKLLASKNYISTNKYVAKCLGLNEAIILGELAGEQDYFEENDLLDDEGFFYITVAKLEDNTTLKESPQRRAIQHLCDVGVLSVKYKGLPRQRLLKINEDRLIEIVDNYQSNKSLNNKSASDLEIKSLTTANLSANKNNNKNNNKVVEKQQPSDTQVTNTSTSERSSENTHKDIDELTVTELQQLKKIVLENRDSQRITYRQIQKQFHLVDKINYDTPALCTKLIKQKQKEQVSEKERVVELSSEIF